MSREPQQPFCTTIEEMRALEAISAGCGPDDLIAKADSGGLVYFVYKDKRGIFKRLFDRLFGTSLERKPD